MNISKIGSAVLHLSQFIDHFNLEVFLPTNVCKPKHVFFMSKKRRVRAGGGMSHFVGGFIVALEWISPYWPMNLALKFLAMHLLAKAGLKPLGSHGHGMGKRAFSNVHSAIGDISADDQSSRIWGLDGDSARMIHGYIFNTSHCSILMKGQLQWWPRHWANQLLDMFY